VLVLKELGCRLKSLVYQKGTVSRKEILDMFRKSDGHLGKRKSSSGKLGIQGTTYLLENNWRRRIYDALNVLQNSGAVSMDEKIISLPQEKKKIVGLLVTKEELYKDLVSAV
jgi:hypothetical protein